MLPALVHPQQPGDGQSAHPADDKDVQPAVVGPGLRRGIEAAAVSAAIADRAHQAVHRQLLAVDGERHLPADVAAELPDDGEGVGHLAAAEGDAPELGDAVGHLCVQPGGADGGREAEVGLHQINVHRPARELRVKVAELLPRAVGAEEIVAAAEGQTPHGGKGAPIGTRQRLIEGAVAARRPDAHRLRSQCTGMARVLGHDDLQLLRRDARPSGGGMDGRGQPGGAVPLACGGVEQKQIAHSASSSGDSCSLS